MAFKRASLGTQQRHWIALNEMNFSSSLVKFSDRKDRNFHFLSAPHLSLTIINLFTTQGNFQSQKTTKALDATENLNGNLGIYEEQHFRESHPKRFHLNEPRAARSGKSEKSRRSSALVIEILNQTSDSIPARFSQRNIIWNVTLSWWSELKLPQKQLLFKLVNRGQVQCRQRFTSSPRPPTKRHVLKWNRFSVAKMFYCSRFTINKQSWAFLLLVLSK